MSEELKPCPFCGSCNVSTDQSEGLCETSCMACDASAGVFAAKDANPWNTRAIKAGQGEAVAWSLPDLEASTVLHSAWLRLSGIDQPSIETLKDHYSAISAALMDLAPPATADAVSVPRELLEEVLQIVDRNWSGSGSSEAYAAQDIRALLAQSQGVKP